MKPAPTSRVLSAAVATAQSRPKVTLGVWALVAALATAGVVQLRFETSTDSILSRGDPAWAYYRQSVARFGGDEIIVVALRASEAFDADTLREVERLTEEIARVPGVRRVDSLASVPSVRSRADGSLDLDPLLGEGWAANGGFSADLVSAVYADRIAPRTLLSDDGTVFAVNALMEDLGAEYDEAAVAGVLEALGTRQAWVTGGPIFRTETNWRMRRELALFVPATLAIIGAILFAIFRSFRAVWIPLGAAGLGTWAMLGALGFSGTPLTISTMILPSILLALGSAYVMHLLVVATGAFGPGEREARILEVARPIALSGLTTAIGFVSMAMVRIDSIRYLGAFGAIGVLAVLAATLTAVPACLQLWPLPTREPRFAAGIRGQLSSLLVELAATRRSWALGIWSVLLGVAVIGAMRVEVETDVTEWFPRGTEVRDSYEEVRRTLSGISPMNVVIQSHDGAPLSRGEAITAIDGLDRFLEGLPQVGKVISVADPLRQMHGGFIGDDQLPLPVNEEEIAQYLVLLESIEHLADVISWDHQWANVLLRVDDNGSIDLLEVAGQAEDWWRAHGPRGSSAQTTGIMFEYARAEHEIAMGQLRGLAFAFAAIAGLLFLIFGQPGVAGAALLPNAVPIVMAFGAMGFLGLPLDAGTVSVGCLALGIAVDDAIHLVTGFGDRRAAGMLPAQALHEAFQALLPALVYTTIAVTAGFVILGASGFLIIRNLGLLTGALMVLCLVADVTLLAALLAGRRERSQTA